MCEGCCGVETRHRSEAGTLGHGLSPPLSTVPEDLDLPGSPPERPAADPSRRPGAPARFSAKRGTAADEDDAMPTGRRSRTAPTWFQNSSRWAAEAFPGAAPAPHGLLPGFVTGITGTGAGFVFPDAGLGRKAERFPWIGRDPSLGSERLARAVIDLFKEHIILIALNRIPNDDKILCDRSADR